jgi:hypothetical protein
MNRKWLGRKQSRAETSSWCLSEDIDENHENHQKTLWSRSGFEQRTTRIQDKICKCKANWLVFTFPKNHRISFDIVQIPTVETASSQKINQQRLRVTSSCYNHHADIHKHPVCYLSTAGISPTWYKLHLCARRRVFFSRTDFLSVKSLTQNEDDDRRTGRTDTKKPESSTQILFTFLTS